MHMKHTRVSSTLIIFITSSLLARIEEDDVPQIGNLTLGASQQPAPLFGFGFGQNIIDRHDTLIYLYPSFIHGCTITRHEVTPTFLYGIRDDLSLLIQLPVAYKLRYGNRCSSEAEDLLIQGEYACYVNDITYNQITVMTNITIPTGSRKKTPTTGCGSTSFLLGGTISHSGPEWYLWAVGGAIFSVTRKHTKIGNQFPYNIGIGKNIAYRPKQWVLALLLECDGIFQQCDKRNGLRDINSGGNTIFIGPSLWFSTAHLTLQAGIAWAVTQRLNGTQNKEQCICACNVGWKFN